MSSFSHIVRTINKLLKKDQEKIARSNQKRICLSNEAVQNYVEKMRGVVGLKMSVFVHPQGKKLSTQGGGLKNSNILSTQFLNAP